MNKSAVKQRAYESVSKFNGLDDKEFNTSAVSFKISDDYNLVVWCDIEYDAETPFRYYIVSVRENTFDELFGEDIGAEYDTNDLSEDEFNKAVDYVLSHQSLKQYER